METANHPFFIYGTLLPGQPNAFIWQGCVAEIMPAFHPRALLYDMGNFPMLIESNEGLEIAGILLYPFPEKYQQLITDLDSLEGVNPTDPDCAYRRLARPVKKECGETETAWVYLGHESYIAGITPIETNNWPTYAAKKMSQMKLWWENFETLFPE